MPGPLSYCGIGAIAGIGALAGTTAGPAVAASAAPACTTYSEVPMIFAWQPNLAISLFKMAKVCVGV